MREKKYVIPQAPIPWCRPGLNGHRFFDKQTKEKLVFGIYLQQQHNDEPLFSKPLSIDFKFYLPMPNVYLVKLRKNPTLIVYATCKPDLDNLCKFVLDAIKSVLISDDKLVYAMTASKEYSDKPRTEFVIREI